MSQETDHGDKKYTSKSSGPVWTWQTMWRQFSKLYYIWVDFFSSNHENKILFYLFMTVPYEMTPLPSYCHNLELQETQMQLHNLFTTST